MTTVEGIRTAVTAEEVKAVLLGSARVADMAAAYEAVTGDIYSGRLRGVKREEIATDMASQILMARETERFKAQSVEEKYEELRTQEDTAKKLQACTMEELEALAEKVGVDAEKYADKPESEKRKILEESLKDKIDIERLEKMVSGEAGTSEIYSLLSVMSREALSEIAISRKIISEGEYRGAWELTDKLMESIKAEKVTRTFVAVKEAVSADKVREILKKADSYTLGEVAKKAGSDFSERCAEKRAEMPETEKLMEWAISWILERLGIDTVHEEGVETEMEIEESLAETEVERQPEAEEEAQTETAEPEEEAPAETTPEAEPEESTVKPEIAFPLEGHTADSLKNIVNTLYSRGNLMSKATGGNFRVSEKLVEELKEYGTTVEEVLRIIKSAGEEWLNGLVFEEDKIVFTGFPAVEDAVKTHAYILLATAINKTSIEQKRIQAKKVDESNEKFAFRVWLVRLGLNGPETKGERKTFYGNLTGHTAFRTKEDEEKWYARRRAKASTSNTQPEE